MNGFSKRVMTLRNYSSFEQGDVVVLELPYSDLRGAKLRPVLVLNAVDLGADLIVAKVTGTPGPHRIALSQEDLLEGRLKKTSYVDCSSIYTVEVAVVHARIARVSPKKMHEVLNGISGIFGISHDY